MSDSQSTRVIQALLQSSSSIKKPDNDVVRVGPVVTISRSYGSGGAAIGKKLAESLEVELFDKELLNRLAEATHIDKKLLERLDEHVQDHLTAWVSSILQGESLFAEDFHRQLIPVVLAIAKRGGVIVGRGAHLILADDPTVYKVCVTASPDVCAKRIMERDKLELKDARRKCQSINKERETILRRIHDRDPRDLHQYDLIINTDHLSVEDAVQIISKGLEIRTGMKQEAVF